MLSYNYLDEFFARLSKLGVGCHFGNRPCVYTPLLEDLAMLMML